MSIENNIYEALNDHDNVIVTGANQGRILEVVEKMTGEIGKTLPTGAVSYNFHNKKVYVGDMPFHPSLGDAARITV